MLNQQPTYLSCHFCFQDGLSSSLVLLEDKQKIMKQLFEQPNSEFAPIFIWIEAYQILQGCLGKEIQNEVKSEIVYFQTIEQAVWYITQNDHKKNVIIICSYELTDNVSDYLCQQDNVKKIICFPLCPESQESKTQYKKNQLKNIIGPKFLQGTNQILKLYECLKKQKQKSKISKILPNFISIKDQVWSSNILVRTMLAMLNQETDRKKMSNQLCDLALLLPNLDSQDIQLIEQFRAQLSNKRLTSKEAIRWYTKQSCLYPLVNNLLRSSRHPSQIFYIQPFFQDLFHAIQNLYEHQQKEQKYEKTIFYRGGKMAQEQIKYFQQNSGCVIQNLGFLSATKLKQKKWVSNVFFKIFVENHESKYSNDYGFAFVQKYSEYKDQQQIIFNPLNYFKILSVSEKQEDELIYYQIKLEYTNLLQKNENELNIQLFNTKKIIQYQFKQFKNICQGNVLLDENLWGCFEYWKKYIQIANSKQMISQGKSMLGIYEMNKENYVKALQHFQQAISNEVSFQNCYKHQTNLNHIALTLSKMGKYSQAIKLYEKCSQLLSNVDKSRSLEWVILQINIGYSLWKSGKCLQGIQIYNKISEPISKIIGQYHPIFSAYLNNTGLMYSQLGNHQKAIQILQRSANIKRIVLGKNNSEYAQALNNIGQLYSKMKKIQTALTYFNQSLEIVREAQNNKSLEGIILNNIGTNLADLQQFEKALEYLQESLLIQHNHGQNYTAQTVTLSNIASILFRVGLPNEALQLYEKNRQTIKTIQGENNMEYALILNNLAMIYSTLQNYNQAKSLYSEALIIIEGLCGKHHQQYKLVESNKLDADGKQMRQ